jgi:hypothetical protein
VSFKTVFTSLLNIERYSDNNLLSCWVACDDSCTPGRGFTSGFFRNHNFRIVPFLISSINAFRKYGINVNGPHHKEKTFPSGSYPLAKEVIYLHTLLPEKNRCGYISFTDISGQSRFLYICFLKKTPQTGKQSDRLFRLVSANEIKLIHTNIEQCSPFGQ